MSEEQNNQQSQGAQETQIEKVNVFSLKQLPIIEQQLAIIGTEIDKKLAELNLENQLATEDTVQTLKKLKASLNKEAADFEEKRKAIKNAIVKPYNEFEELYKEHIINKYNNAEEILKQKIIDYELKIKQDKQNILVQYFNELKTLYKIDWITWEQIGIEVKLSTTESAYKKDIMAKFKDIQEALGMINTQEHAAEILVEYKKSLNANNAITIVKQRKEEEKLEQECLLQQRTTNRIQKLQQLGFTPDQTGFICGELCISTEEVQSLENDDFTKKYVEFENAIAASKPSETPNVVSAPTRQSHPAPIPSAAPQTEEPIRTACIEVKATLPTLQILTAWLKENGIEYRNIKEYKKD